MGLINGGIEEVEAPPAIFRLKLDAGDVPRGGKGWPGPTSIREKSQSPESPVSQSQAPGRDGSNVRPE